MFRWTAGRRARVRCLTWIIAGEFAEGFGDIRQPACAAMLARFDIFEMNLKTAVAISRKKKSIEITRLGKENSTSYCFTSQVKQSCRIASAPSS